MARVTTPYVMPLSRKSNISIATMASRNSDGTRAPPSPRSGLPGSSQETTAAVMSTAVTTPAASSPLRSTAVVSVLASASEPW